MAWKNKTPEEIREYHRKYHHRRSKEAILNKYLAQKKRRIEVYNKVLEIKHSIGCQKCNENDPACLDFHHINDDKEFAVAEALTGNINFKIIEKEIAKCIVLCANCHRKLHYYEKQSVAQG